MKVCNFTYLDGIIVAIFLTSTNCIKTHCSHLAEHHSVVCSGQHSDKISKTVRLGASKTDLFPPIVDGKVRLLNLSRSALTAINSSSFLSLKHPEALEILDLSYNKLMFISPGTFKALSRLKILLLNNNQLHALNRSSFAELKSLEELNLDANPLFSFPDRTFTPLSKLRKISIMSNQLSCDCQIADLLRFLNKDVSVQVSNQTVCTFPRSLRGNQIASLDVKILKRSCGKGDFTPAVFDLEPNSRSLIVYSGIEKNITCKVSKSNGIYMEWLKNNVPVVESPRISIEPYEDSEFQYLKLNMNPVTWEDEADWICYVEQGASVLRNTVRLTPVLVNSVHCVQEWQADEKGEIIWPLSKQGMIAVKCPNGPMNGKAFRRCKHGKWDMADTTQCTYASPFIKHFLTLLRRKRTSVRSLGFDENYSFTLVSLGHDTMQKAIILTILKFYAGNLHIKHKSIVQDIKYGNELLRTNKLLNKLSAYETRLIGWLLGNSTSSAGRKFVAALNFVLYSEYARTELNGELLRLHLQQLFFGEQIIVEENIAICQHLMFTKEYNDGLEASKSGFIALHDGAKFSCYEQPYVELLPATGGTSLRIPHAIINRFPLLIIIRIIWLVNSNMFKSQYTSDGRWKVLHEVYGVAIKHISSNFSKSGGSTEQATVPEMNSPDKGFFVSFRINEKIEQIQLGMWNGQDRWELVNETNCPSYRIGPNNVLFSCSREFFTSNVGENTIYFTAMQYELVESSKLSAKLTWWTYASLGFVASAMLSTVIINFCSFSLVKKCSHRRQQVIINMCACIFAQCILYAFVGSKIQNDETCLAVTIAQHFFFLAVFFWIMQAFKILREEFERSFYDDDNGEGGRKIRTKVEKVALRGTILAMYFIAYGVPLIAILIVLATDALSNDRSLMFCFPLPGMQMSVFAFALYGPLSICLVITCGVLINILRLLIIARKVSPANIAQKENDGVFSNQVVSAEILQISAGSATSQLLQVTLWLLLIIALYSLDCYTVAIHIYQFSNTNISPAVSLSSNTTAFLNILLAVITFYSFTLEPARLFMRKVFSSDRSTYVAEYVVHTPHHSCITDFSKEISIIVPLLRRQPPFKISAG